MTNQQQYIETKNSRCAVVIRKPKYYCNDNITFIIHFISTCVNEIDTLSKDELVAKIDEFKAVLSKPNQTLVDLYRNNKIVLNPSPENYDDYFYITAGTTDVLDPSVRVAVAKDDKNNSLANDRVISITIDKNLNTSSKATITLANSDHYYDSIDNDGKRIVSIQHIPQVPFYIFDVYDKISIYLNNDNDEIEQCFEGYISNVSGQNNGIDSTITLSAKDSSIFFENQSINSNPSLNVIESLGSPVTINETVYASEDNEANKKRIALYFAQSNLMLCKNSEWVAEFILALKTAFEKKNKNNKDKAIGFKNLLALGASTTLDVGTFLAAQEIGRVETIKNNTEKVKQITEAINTFAETYTSQLLNESRCVYGTQVYASPAEFDNDTNKAKYSEGIGHIQIWGSDVTLKTKEVSLLPIAIFIGLNFPLFGWTVSSNFSQTHSTWKSFMDILDEITSNTYFEWFFSNDGTFFLKPPSLYGDKLFYNENGTVENGDQQPLGYEIDSKYLNKYALNFNTNYSADIVKTMVPVAGQFTELNLALGTNAFNFTYKDTNYSISKYGRRYLPQQSRPGISELPHLVLFGATRMALNNVNAFNGELTLDLNGKFELGDVLILKEENYNWFIHGITHSYTVNGECTTKLQLYNRISFQKKNEMTNDPYYKSILALTKKLEAESTESKEKSIKENKKPDDEAIAEIEEQAIPVGTYSEDLYDRYAVQVSTSTYVTIKKEIKEIKNPKEIKEKSASTPKTSIPINSVDQKLKEGTKKIGYMLGNSGVGTVTPYINTQKPMGM